jgi:hypothetical protein
MNGKVKILFFCMIFVAGRAFCQNATIINAQHSALKFYKTAALKPSVTIKTPAISNTALLFFSPSYLKPTVLASDYYSSHLGFFCKKEIQLEKIISIPFKFRLGSVQQCDWLEGKNVALTR